MTKYVPNTLCKFRFEASTCSPRLRAGTPRRRPPLFVAPARPASARCTGCLTPVRPTGPQHPQCDLGGCHSPRNAHAPAQAAPTGPSLLDPPDYDRGLAAAPAKYFSSANPPLAPSLRPCLFICLDDFWLAVSHPSLSALKRQA